MKKAVLYILPIAYTVLGTFVAWCGISFSSIAMSLFGGPFNKTVLLLLFLGGVICVCGIAALLICNYCFIDYSLRPKRTIVIELLECAVLFIPLMALWEKVFEGIKLCVYN